VDSRSGILLHPPGPEGVFGDPAIALPGRGLHVSIQKGHSAGGFRGRLRAPRLVERDRDGLHGPGSIKVRGFIGPQCVA